MSAFPKRVKYPQVVDEMAAIVGFLRKKANEQLRQNKPEYDRDTDVDVMGAWGEMVAQFILFLNGKEFTATKLIAEHPLHEPDIIVGNQCYDVKAMKESGNAFYVNYDAHMKDKRITHYLFIQPIGELEARYWVFKHSEVNEWEIKKMKYSEVFYMPVGG